MRGGDAWRTMPLDERAAATLREGGFVYALIDANDNAALDSWFRADQRGFHLPRPSDTNVEAVAERRARLAQSRLIGVWDATATGVNAPTEPAATTQSWVSELTVPGGALDMWAISSVTVSPAHAGRGIARALLEGELRTAVAAGLAIAGLTVSESTLYGRYGFGIAAEAATLEIETSRVRWAGPSTAGTFDVIDAATAAERLLDVHERARLASPGEVAVASSAWRRATGADDPNGSSTRRRRFVQYRSGVDDPSGGAVDGVVVYRLENDPSDFTKHTLEVEYLGAANDEAAAALWRLVLGVPLVATVRAPLRPADDPVRWMLGDYRAARATTVDHHWLRILDVPAAIEARTYGSPGRLGLLVRDDLGFADGAFVLEVDASGRGAVTRLDDAPPDLPTLELDAAALASLYLGGVSADLLRRADRIRPSDAVTAIALADRLFGTGRAPWLSTWY